MRTIQHKLPTFLGLFIIALATGIGVLLVQNQKTYRSSASPDETPSQIKITNVTDKSFTVSWTTDKSTSGFVAYGTSDILGETIGQQTPFLIHHITIENLMPSTKYYLKIGSGKTLFDNNERPYEIKTAPVIKQVPNPDMIFGTIKLSSGLPAVGVVVYVAVPGVEPLSAQTDFQGRWTIPFSTARNNSLFSYVLYDKEKTLMEIYVQGENGRFATARLTTKLSRPVPPITLGQNYDFSGLNGTIQTNLDPQKEDKSPTSQVTLPETTPSPSPNPLKKRT